MARIKGKFTSTANARVLATQKSIERIMHTKDDAGKTQLERIISEQSKVAETNTDAKSLTGISRFLDHVDEISGAKAAREALTKEINAPVVPTVIMIGFPEGVKPMEERPPEPLKPSWVHAEVVQQNPAPSQEYPTGYWQGARNRRHTKTSGPIENDRRSSQ